MKKILTLSLTLVMGLLVAQNSVSTKTHNLKKFMHSNELDAKPFIQAQKQKNVSRDFPGEIWVSFNDAFDIYASNQSTDNYNWSWIWEDSSVVYAYDDNGTPSNFHWWIHSFGQVFDPYTEILGTAYNAEEWFDGEKAYIIDSLQVPYAYIRTSDSSIVDTLIISVVKNSGISPNYFIDANSQPTNKSAPIVAYDYNTNEPASGDKDRYEILLTVADTTSFGLNQTIDMGGMKLDKGERLAVTVNYKSGSTWNFADTVAVGSNTPEPVNSALNRCFFMMYEEVVGDLPISYQVDAHHEYNQGLFVASDLRYNDAGSWNGAYIPSFAYSSPDFYWEHLVMQMKMEPVGVDFFYNKNGLTVDFFDNSNFSPTNWKWEFNDGTGNQMGGQNVSYTFPLPGAYNVCLEANNGTDYYTACKSVTVDFGIGINEVNDDLVVKVFPNPATNNLNIDLNASKIADLKISLFDILGNEVYRNEINSTDKLNDRISLEDLAGGLYILNINHGESTINQNINVIK